MSVSAIDISALASQLTSNFLASLTNATVVTNTNTPTTNIPIKYECFCYLNMYSSIFLSSIINRDGQSANVGTAQTIMLTNSPNSIILAGPQQQQATSSVPPINRNLIDQESMIYASTSSANPGRNELFYEPTNAKQARLWQ